MPGRGELFTLGPAAPRDASAPFAAPGEAISVSVVICAYTEDRWDDLAAAVASVLRQSLPPLETIVVVDHNQSLLRRARQELSGVTAIPNREARGLSGARNSGIAAARGTVLAFLDDDAIAEPRWLARLVAPYRDPRVAGVGGSIDALWSGGRPAPFPPEFDWVVGCTYRGMPDRRSPVRNMIGANMSVRREVFRTVGGFRSGIGRVGKRPVGCEETELCIRAQQRHRNAVFLFEPGARVRHRVPTDRAGWSYFRSRCFAEGLSKARVSAHAGVGDGLATERTYTSRTLPVGVARGVGDTLLRRDPSGLLRAAWIVAGLSLTVAGYVAGTIGGRRMPQLAADTTPELTSQQRLAS